MDHRQNLVRKLKNQCQVLKYEEQFVVYLSTNQIKIKIMLGKVKAWIGRRKKLIIVTAIAGGSFLSYSFVEDYYFEVGKNLDIYTTLFRDVNIYYVDSIQPGELMKKGIDAMLSTLDPYTVYIPESEIEDYKMTHISAEYGGIGALVHQRNGEIEISEVYEGFPAQK